MCSVLPFFDAGEVENVEKKLQQHGDHIWPEKPQIKLNLIHIFFRFLVFRYLCIQIVSDASNFELWRLPELLGHWGNQLWWVYGDQGDTIMTQKQIVWLSITSASDVSHHCHHQRSCIFFQAGVIFCKVCRKFTHFWHTFYKQISDTEICCKTNLRWAWQPPPKEVLPPLL